MASHHPYHHHHPQNPIPIPTSAAPCNCHYNQCCSQSPPPPQHLSIDPIILQSLTLLLQNQQPNHQTHLTKHQTRKNPNPNVQFHAQNLHSELPGEDHLTHPVISSLLQRISSLESSLAQFHASSSSGKQYYPSNSLREAAARVIQAHFRAFLVRRSRTLSQIQDLAFIKSSFNSLKSSVSNKTQFNYRIVSQKAMDLLLKLDSIQGGDPMIRDGKGSISGNIVRFLEYIDGITVKRHERACKSVKNVRFVRNSSKHRALNSNEHLSVPQKELVKKLSERVEKIRGFSRVFDNDEEDVELEGFQELIDDDDDDDDNDEEEEYQRVLVDRKHVNSKSKNGVLVKSTCGKPRVKKTVSFAENGDLCRIFSDPPEPVLNGDGSLSDESDDDDGEHLDYNGIEEQKGTIEDAKNDEVYQDEKAAYSHINNGERRAARNPRSEYCEMISYDQDEDGRLVFSPPVPVKMESRADLMQKKKTVKIVT